MDISETKKGKVISVCISKEKHIRKMPLNACLFKEDYGLEEDSHAGPGNKQVSLLARESVLKMETKKVKLPPGIFGENLRTEGIDFSKIEIGKKIKIGKNVILEVTEKGKTCLKPCSIFKSVGFCVMPTEGIFGKVLRGGVVKEGDPLEVIE